VKYRNEVRICRKSYLLLLSQSTLAGEKKGAYRFFPALRGLTYLFCVGEGKINEEKD